MTSEPTVVSQAASVFDADGAAQLNGSVMRQQGENLAAFEGGGETAYGHLTDEVLLGEENAAYYENGTATDVTTHGVVDREPSAVFEDKQMAKINAHEGMEEGGTNGHTMRDPRRAQMVKRDEGIVAAPKARKGREGKGAYESPMAGRKRAREQYGEHEEGHGEEQYTAEHRDDRPHEERRDPRDRDDMGDRYDRRERDERDDGRRRGRDRRRGSRLDDDREYNYSSRYRERSPDEAKRARKECYRCGGRNHIVMMCTSTERDACKNLSLPQCHRCDGRGHDPDNCPTIVNANPCYRCRQPGHFARDCPYDDPLSQQGRGGGGGPPPRFHQQQSDHGPLQSQLMPMQGLHHHHGGPPQGMHGSSHQGGGGIADAVAAAAQAYGYSTPAHMYAALGMANGYGAAYGYNNQNQGWGSSSYGDYGRGGSSGGGGMGGRMGRDMGRFDRGRGRDRGREPNTAVGKCFRCNEDGHWTRDCPQRPADADPDGCYKCGKPGHKSRECNACYNCGEDGHRAADCRR